MKNHYLFIVLVFISSCVAQSKTSFNSKSIYGSWYLTANQINYPQLTFNLDSTTIFSSRADTVYRFKFFIKNDTLFLKDIYTNVHKAKIIKLNADSLIFETLIENTAIQRYAKKSNQ